MTEPEALRGPVRHPPLAMQVSAQFRDLITSGHWTVGQKIPGEHELAAELGVSRATVREALRGLTISGLLEPRIGDGTYVRATNEITGALMRQGTVSLLEHALDARAGLEAASARSAARHATPAALQELRAALETRNRARDSGDLVAYAKADSAFHRAVVHAGANPVLIRLHTAVAEVMDQSIEDTAVLPEGPGVGQAHERLVRAICRKRPQEAADIVLELIESVKDAAP